MRAIVINLVSASERMAFQKSQLEKLGIDYQRLEAFDGTNATALRPQDYWDTWQRPLRSSEKACFLSHRKAWEIVAASGEPMLVLEDDAILSRNTAAFLKQVEDAKHLDFVTLEVRGRKKLIAKLTTKREEDAPIRRLYQDRTGAAAYILYPSGAEKLLAKSERKCGLADAVIAAAYELRAYQADPALALQIDRCEYYGIEQPIVTQSSIGTTKPSNTLSKAGNRYIGFKIRRIMAQLRMGLRRIVKSPVAIRREIDLDKSGFDRFPR